MFNPEDTSKDKGYLGSNESKNITIGISATESLLYPKQGVSMWPEDIKNSEEIRAQAEMRRNLYSQLDSLFDLIQY